MRTRSGGLDVASHLSFGSCLPSCMLCRTASAPNAAGSVAVGEALEDLAGRLAAPPPGPSPFSAAESAQIRPPPSPFTFAAPPTSAACAVAEVSLTLAEGLEVVAVAGLGTPEASTPAHRQGLPPSGSSGSSGGGGSSGSSGGGSSGGGKGGGTSSQGAHGAIVEPLPGPEERGAGWLDPDCIRLCTHEDGTLVTLGSGAFGNVGAEEGCYGAPDWAGRGAQVPHSCPASRRPAVHAACGSGVLCSLLAEATAAPVSAQKRVAAHYPHSKGLIRRGKRVSKMASCSNKCMLPGGCRSTRGCAMVRPRWLSSSCTAAASARPGACRTRSR